MHRGSASFYWTRLIWRVILLAVILFAGLYLFPFLLIAGVIALAAWGLRKLFRREHRIYRTPYGDSEWPTRHD